MLEKMLCSRQNGFLKDNMPVRDKRLGNNTHCLIVLILKEESFCTKRLVLRDTSTFHATLIVTPK